MIEIQRKTSQTVQSFIARYEDLKSFTKGLKTYDDHGNANQIPLWDQHCVVDRFRENEEMKATIFAAQLQQTQVYNEFEK